MFMGTVRPLITISVSPCSGWSDEEREKQDGEKPKEEEEQERLL